MIRILMYTPRREEQRCLRSRLADYSLRHAWAECELRTAERLSDWRALAEEPGDVQALVCDVSEPGAVRALMALKAACPRALVLPIAGAEVPPTRYVRPEILPFALLWRPLSEKGAASAVAALFERLRAERQDASEPCFALKSRQSTRYIPYREILCFEARDKKLFAETESCELPFRGTISQLAEELPEEFRRCHKSYIINLEHLAAVHWDEQLLELTGGRYIPLSRSYRGAF